MSAEGVRRLSPRALHHQPSPAEPLHAAAAAAHSPSSSQVLGPGGTSRPPGVFVVPYDVLRDFR